MRTPRPLPPGFDDGPFAVSAALAAGISRSRLRRSDVTVGISGVRDTARPQSPDAEDAPWERRRRAVLIRARREMARMPRDAALCLFTAALVLGLPLRPARIDDRIHVVAPADDRRRRRRGVSVHPLPRDAGRFVDVEGLRVTDPVTTWCALSAVLSFEEIVVIGDALVCRENPVATIDELAAAVGRYARRWGVKRLRVAFEFIRARTDSPRESEVRLLLVLAGLPEPEINVVIRDPRGRRIRRGDMVYPRYRVLVEYDGEQHRTDDVQYARDAAALEALAAAGWLVVRVRKGDLRADRGLVVDRVRRALLAHGWPSP